MPEDPFETLCRTWKRATDEGLVDGTFFIDSSYVPVDELQAPAPEFEAMWESSKRRLRELTRDPNLANVSRRMEEYMMRESRRANVSVMECGIPILVSTVADLKWSFDYWVDASCSVVSSNSLKMHIATKPFPVLSKFISDQALSQVGNGLIFAIDRLALKGLETFTARRARESADLKRLKRIGLNDDRFDIYSNDEQRAREFLNDKELLDRVRELRLIEMSFGGKKFFLNVRACVSPFNAIHLKELCRCAQSVVARARAVGLISSQ